VDEHVLHILLGFAGVGATFAGFSGVVAVFGRRAHGEWLPEDLFRLRNLMFMSLGVCLLAFAPLVLTTWHLAQARASSSFALTGAAILQFLNIVGLFFDRGPAPYLAGLLALLCVAAMQFAFLVIRPLTPAV
jgi:hypothetical protein